MKLFLSSDLDVKVFGVIVNTCWFMLRTLQNRVIATIVRLCIIVISSEVAVILISFIVQVRGKLCVQPFLLDFCTYLMPFEQLASNFMKMDISHPHVMF